MTIEPTFLFLKEAKRLTKKYPSLKNEIAFLGSTVQSANETRHEVGEPNLFLRDKPKLDPMARDKYHYQFRRAIEKEGWLITHDSFDFSVGQVDFEIDLGAERILGAEKDGKKVAIEIKCFLEDSPVSAFHKATGQYDNYFVGLSFYDPSRTLYLAIPEFVHSTFFQRPFVKLIVEMKSIKIITFDPITEKIIQWIEN